MYGQASHSAVYGYPPSRPQTLFQQQYYQPPPPQPPATSLFHVDPTSFRRDFTSRLSNLTFNSRVHIQDLSLMAQDYPQYANIVTQCIDQHIRQVPAWMKLPCFYLLDAIAKNVYDVYASVFSRVVVALFVDTYFQVDSNTRIKMEEMLLTWRTAGPEYTELFGPDNQVRLQTAVWGDQSFASKDQVLAELQFILGQMERALQTNPHDRMAQTHIQVLNQLQRLVERGVSQGELRQILDQLRTLTRSALPPPIVRPQRQAPHVYASQPSYPPQSVPPPYPQPPVASKPVSMPASSTIPTHATDFPAVPPNLENLFASLVNAGIILSSNAPSSANSSAPAPVIKESTPISENQELEQSALREYRNAILSEPIKLTTLDLSKTKSRVVDYMYDRQASQCKQCGIRFMDNKLGRKQMDDHLDMHFRQNSKLDQGRSQSRSWFISLEDWLHDASSDGKGRGHDLGPTNSKVERAKDEARLRAQFVVVPAGAEAQPVSCPICKESLKSEFLEEDEDWVWRNAVKKDDKIYHATCHAEALASTSNIVARLRTEKAHGSRSATPEVQDVTNPELGLRTTLPQSMKSRSISPPQLSLESKVAGIKRKVEQTDSNLPQEANGTPPHKKVALPALLISSS